MAPTLLEVLVRNLVDNALRYGPAGAQIQVHWRQDGASNACLEVHDSGPGLKEADSARLGSASFACWAQGPAAAAWAGPSCGALPRCKAPRCTRSLQRGPRGLAGVGLLAIGGIKSRLCAPGARSTQQ